MQKLTVKNLKPIQNDFLGNGAVYHGYAAIPDHMGRNYNEELCEIEAKRVADMRLKIARTFYGWWAYDREKKCWDWETPWMQGFYKWLERMKKAGVTVALNTGWCSPGDINSTHWNGESPFNVPGNWEASLQNYADWVSESVHQLIEVRGFDNIKILVMFTEPQHFGGKPTNEGDSAYKVWFDAVRAAHNALVRDGRRDKVMLMGPNEGSTTTSDMLKWVIENGGNEYIDIFSSHNYQYVDQCDPKLIKSGVVSPALTSKFATMEQIVNLKPNTDYEAEIDLLYRSDFIQEGGNVFGVYKCDESGKILNGGLAPALCEGALITLKATDLSPEYKKYKVKFNSGESTRGILGIFCGIEAPEELKNQSLCFSEHKGKQLGIVYIDSITLREAESGKIINKNHDFSDEYSDWKYSSSAGGVYDQATEWNKWAKLALSFINGEPAEKSYCYDEYNIIYNRDNDRDQYGCELVNSSVALMNSGVRATLLWTAFDQQWPDNHSTNADSFVDGDHRCGFMPNLRRSLVPYKAFYAFTLLSRYIDRNSQTFEGIGGNCVHTVLSRSKDGNITVVVTNCKDKAEDFTIDFEKELGVSLYRHCFDPKKLVPNEKAEVIPADKTFKVDGTLSDTIASYGVTVYTTYND